MVLLSFQLSNFLFLFFQSAKTDSYELTADMKEEYKQAFEALDDEKKWPLNDGTKVEDVMYAYGASCTYEQ